MSRYRAICDEVMSSWGRTGHLWAHQAAGIDPDIITTAKGLTSGYAPMGAVVAKKKISDIFNDMQLLYGLTYSAHPLPCAIANSCMDLYEKNDFELFRNVAGKAIIVDEFCYDIAETIPFVNEYRSNGLLGCLELDLDDNILPEVSSDLIHNGVHNLRIKQNLMVAPPLTVDEKTIEHACGVIKDTLLGIWHRYNSTT